LCLICVGSVYGYAKLRLGDIKVINNLPFGHSSGGLAPMNILLVGDNSRVGLSPSEAAQFGTAADAGGAHSDVTMILHLNPSTGSAALLSIPRDMFVPLPPTNITGDVGKIDSALNGSNQQFTDGAAQLVTTIQNDLGINIDHYVEVNFDGFQQTVNALGGINMDFPDLLFDAESTLRNGQTGCIHLNGAMALALVRSRHLQYYERGYNVKDPHSWPQEAQSDLARIQRDHTFLKVLASSVVSQGITTNLVKANDILSSLINQVTIDPGLKSDLLTLAKRYRSANLATIPELTLPVSVVPDAQYHYLNGAYGQVDFPVQPVDSQVVAQWQGRAIPKVDPSSVAVVVRNISNVNHEAATTAAGLEQLGFRATNAGQGTVPADAVETMIHYNPGATGLADAETVLQSLAGSVMMQSDPSVPSGVVDVDTGSSVTVLGSGAASSGGTAATSSSGSASTTTTLVSTPGGQPVSSATDQLSPWDPVACKPGQKVVNG
jgi:LCP family protein required for cell wall assembly